MLKKPKSLLIFWRINLVQGIFIIFFLLLLFKYFSIQVLAHNQYSAIAGKQHWVGRQIPAERGKILSSDGFPLAVDVNAYLLFAVPSEIDNPEETAKKLLAVLGYESKAKTETEREKEKKDRENEIIEKLEQKQLKWVALADKLDQKTKNSIEQLNLAGLGFEKEFKRFYPEGSLASHVLGFVGSDTDGNETGYYGIEGYFNGTLKGLSGKYSEEQDPSGRPIPIGDYIPLSPENGEDVVLTINRDLQYLVEKKLKTGVEKYDAKSGTVIILEPQTGKIIAMANYPNYDPGNWQKSSNNDFKEGEIKEKYMIGKDIFLNIAVGSDYEPGSVFKPITVSAGLETGKITPETTFESKPFEVQGHVIRTWDNKYYGTETIAEILQHSDNTGAAWLATQLGVDVVYEFFSKYHLGEKVDLKLEDEGEGIVKPKSEWKPIDLATAGFGQGISITPLQLIGAFGAIANNGQYLTPQIVKEIRSEDTATPIKTTSGEQIISPETARSLVDMLTSVVEKGEFKFAVLPGYKIAGKTGTAQIPRNGVYDPNKTNCTFIGFAPASDPKFVMLVKLEEPTASTYSAETAVPLWMDIAKDLFIYYGIAPQ